MSIFWKDDDFKEGVFASRHKKDRPVSDPVDNDDLLPEDEGDDFFPSMLATNEFHNINKGCVPKNTIGQFFGMTLFGNSGGEK